MTRIIGCYFIPDINDDKYPSLIHDHNLAIYCCGRIETYLHQERISRIKYDASIGNTFEEISRELSLIPAKKNIFVFVDHEIGRASISRKGQIRLESTWKEGLENTLEPARLYWFGEWPEAYMLNHELAHLYSCIPFYGMFKENSLLVHFDGGASQSNFSAWTFLEGKIKLVEAHYDLKWLSGLFNANALVFSMVGAKKNEQNAVPGKFMGLEAYGEYRKEIENWLIDEDYFKDCWSSKKHLFDSIKRNFGVELKHIDIKNKFIQDIASTIHAVFIRESLKVFKRLQGQIGADYLYYSGGTALNIKLNNAILQSGLFKNIFIPPSTNDSGLAIGAAVAVAIHKGEKVGITGPFLNNYKIEGYNIFEYSQNDLQLAAKEIIEGKVLAICNGYGEAGPRALGNRSIIARADNKKLAQKISQECKKREWFRPIAPVILEKNLELLTGEETAPEIAQFMLTEFSIKRSGVSLIEGCVHVDGTSRIQVIKERSFNPFLYDLLTYLDVSYGLKALINTSFNRQGEPIVHTRHQAIESAKSMKLDGVIINGKLKILSN